MDKKKLKEAFETVFHSKESFEDFCTLNLFDEIIAFEANQRTVYRTKKRLKNYLRFIDRVILSDLDYNSNVVHSYVKGKSALSAVKQHAVQSCFFMTDIKDFFSSIKSNDVERVLINNLTRNSISDLDQYLDRINEMICWGGSLPVGFPTSPKISNSFLMEFDNELESYCSKNNLVYTRYSDDIIISSSDIERLNGLDEQVQIFLNENSSGKMVVNTKKTKITHIGNKVKILGLIITPDGRVTIDSKYKKIIESLLHFYINDKDKYESLLFKEMKGKESSLFGMLHYAKSIDDEYIEKLQRKYGAFTLSSLMEDKGGE